MPAGADGLVVVPYLEGERTPNRPFATGAVHGLRLKTATPAHLARAAVEGVLCGLAAGLDALLAEDVRVERVILIGGASRSEAVRRIAPGILGRPVAVPVAAQHVALGARRARRPGRSAATTFPPRGPPAGVRSSKRSRSTSSGPATPKSAR